MKSRTPWQGMITIARLNWPYYVAAGALLAACAPAVLLSHGLGVQIACGLGLLGALWFIAGSLGVSHLVYDRSDLYRLHWLERVLPRNARRVLILCHCGFDDLSAALCSKVEGEWRVLDHYDPARMSEPSIQRARRLYPPHGSEPARYDRWPTDSGAAAAILGVLAIHELRSVEERAAWFREAKRCLAPGGRIVLVEHLRDRANFAAFGPGFFHFHSRTNWCAAWQKAGLGLREEFSMTPWVRVFLLEAP